MNILKNIVFVVLGIVALALIIAIFIDGDFSYEQTVKIDAPIEKVWQVLSNFEHYEQWNPFTPKVELSKVIGEPVYLHVFAS